jgi:hypothetical protein
MNPKTWGNAGNAKVATTLLAQARHGFTMGISEKNTKKYL